ncbi:MAG: C40 family peptidase, partial [Pyrinomonadaceae bacterium]
PRSMSLNKFPLALAVCLALCTLAASASAQSDVARPRQVISNAQPDGSPRLETDVYLVSEAAPAMPDVAKPEIVAPHANVSRLFQFNRQLLNAIEDRLGAPYVYGASGPNVFDCSGFVWSAFQSAGVQFQRVSARTMWDEFVPVGESEQRQFGTLVFFNNLKHVGIVADANGFYQASSSHGVQYTPFNDYWTSRIVGYRRIPLPTPFVAE